jgi:hypothetical protein
MVTFLAGGTGTPKLLYGGNPVFEPSSSPVGGTTGDDQLAQEIHRYGHLFAVANLFDGADTGQLLAHQVEVGVGRSGGLGLRFAGWLGGGKQATGFAGPASGHLGLAVVTQKQTGEGDGGGALADADGAMKDVGMVQPAGGELLLEDVHRLVLADDLLHQMEHGSTSCFPPAKDRPRQADGKLSSAVNRPAIK